MLKIIDDERYLDSVREHIQLTLKLLKESKQFFSIAVNKEGIKFDPELPEELMSNFSPFTVLSLHNYTFDSLEMLEDHIVFEAGFGKENLASTLQIPYCAILQVVVDDIVILSNPAASLSKNFTDHVATSANVFKSNPNNFHLFDK
jgi:hypothetical protein